MFRDLTHVTICLIFHGRNSPLFCPRKCFCMNPVQIESNRFSLPQHVHVSASLPAATSPVHRCLVCRRVCFHLDVVVFQGSLCACFPSRSPVGLSLLLACSLPEPPQHLLWTERGVQSDEFVSGPAALKDTQDKRSNMVGHRQSARREG